MVDYIYKISWNSFKNHPILGNGIAALDRLYGINYDHSIILQLLNECGIIFLLIHIIIIFKGIFIIYKYWNQDLNTSRFLLFLACNSIIRLLFSYVLWLEQGYWMFLYVAFAYKLKKT